MIYGSDYFKSTHTETQKSFFKMKQKKFDHELKKKKGLNGTEMCYLPDVKE